MDILINIPIYILLFSTLYFEVFVIVTYFEEVDQFTLIPSVPRDPETSPSVTIMVPAWNEGRTILGTVDSLLALDYPKDKLSIFIIDDGSTDDTLQVAKTFEHNPQVRIFTKPNGGKHTAVNLGIDNCTSELIGCLDADSFVDPKALQEIIPFFDNPEVMAVTPSVQIWKPDNLLRRIQAAEYMVGEFTRKIFSRLNALYVTPGPFSIYRNEVFEKIGKFAKAYNTEDMEMALRMQANHMKIENAHNALVFTVSPKTIHALYKQRVRWVSGFLKNAFFNYRFMFFKREYGNLGALTMPFAFSSIFVALFFYVLYVKNIFTFISVKYLEYTALGFHFGFPHGFDWFSVNLEFRRLIIYLLFFCTIFFVLMGARMVMRKFRISRDMLYFLAFYGFIAPFWLIRSLYNLLTTKEAHWR